MEFGDKGRFRQILKQLGLAMIPGEQVSREALMGRGYGHFSLLYGKDMVFQLPDITKGGGRSTFFIRSEMDYMKFLRCISNGRYRGYQVRTINVATLIEGFPASVAVCATRHGALISSIQTQVMDIPEVLKVHRGNGFFCGHDWTYRKYSPSLNEQAMRIAQILSGYMWAKGYRGIFGIDLVVDEKAHVVYPVECNTRYTGAFPMLSMLHVVYPVECNTRYTGAFPMLSMLHVRNGAIPMDLFHILEFLDVDYEIDVDALNEAYRRPIGGGHIILFNKSHVPLKVGRDVRSGVYRCDPGGHDEFILTDGVPRKENIVVFNDELTRMCRVLFPFQIIESPMKLNDKAREIICQVYDQFAFQPLGAEY
jgi:hypothetical protein